MPFKYVYEKRDVLFFRYMLKTSMRTSCLEAYNLTNVNYKEVLEFLEFDYSKVLK